MAITIIAAALLLWLVLGGIVAILVCPLLKEDGAEADSRIAMEQPRKVIVPHATSESYR
jgi:hypothetical protein